MRQCFTKILTQRKDWMEKTKDNFLNPLSEKYLFAPKIKFEGKEVLIKEVQNFETLPFEENF